jgi:radical SAM-linked protein
MAVSQGFNPRPKIVFALALALGIEGRREVVDLELAEPMEPAEVLRRLAAASPPGLDWLDVEGVAPGRPAPQAEAVRYVLEVPVDRQDAARSRLATLLASTQWPYTRHRPDRDVAIDVRPFVLGAELDPLGVLRFRMKMTPNGSARPEEVIDALGLSDLLGQGTVLIRTEVELVP